MLVTTQFVKNTCVERLTKLWTERYIPDLSPSSLFPDPWSYNELFELASPKGRASTIAKLQPSLVDLNCQMAGILAKDLYEYIPNVVDLNEARQLSQYTYQAYLKILEVYQHSSGITTEKTSMLLAMGADSELSVWGIPDIEKLAKKLQPVLLELQEQHVRSKDWRSLGFMTTLFNFSNKLLLYKLTPLEQVLINPYFKFVEEQVAIPWERVCAAAAKHQVDSAALTLVEQMLPESNHIAQAVYKRMTQLAPNYRSPRGGLTSSGVAHSCIRDLNMFQAYLWLCVLEESMKPIEQELVALCVMVLESVGVSWELIALWIPLLTDEIISRVTPEQRSFLQPYIQGMQQAFFKRRQRFGVTCPDFSKFAVKPTVQNQETTD